MGSDLFDLAKRAGIVWAIGLLFILMIIAIGYAIEVLLLFFAGVLFAILLRTFSALVSRYTGLGENLSLTTTVLFFLSIVAIGLWILIPSIAEQTEELRQSLPKAVERLEGSMKRYDWGRWVLEKTPEPGEFMPRRGDLFTRITGVVSGMLGVFAIVLLIFFIGLFLAIQPSLYIDGIVKLVTLSKRDRAREILGQIGTGLKWWLAGKLVDMFCVGGLTFLGLRLLGIGMALTLAVLAALLTFIPNFGPIIAAVPAVLIGLLEGPTTALWVVGLYVAIQTIESYVITPVIQQQAVSLPPALTITSQLVMAVFVGGLGLALATPLTVVALVLVRTLYIQDTLGDEA